MKPYEKIASFKENKCVYNNKFKMMLAKYYNHIL